MWDPGDLILKLTAFETRLSTCGLGLSCSRQRRSIIRDRFGRDAMVYAATALDGPRSVPDGFRELAEKEL
ncbi:MAG: hypothetical protein E5Y10_15355 [Mesorhizobium sp.]|nr:MAG: hypothetical protein EOS13_18255 [Mesorhizobium sp.]RWO84046.1 MAG: hypothetical protein EOS18_04185 [Mesorhizobium sp.]TIN26335.1 MAG: hypothetical protein E5Y19_14710 [Mesorhizobium sp.]TIN38350.1 MAG: hypothetical protein E5Y13_16620 [Mesorhizobium sp.]TJU82879.1 MAG: hypothetical protein E5Y15_16030 [Mesorhizobium sp.]